jgi:hypothetical protein
MVSCILNLFVCIGRLAIELKLKESMLPVVAARVCCTRAVVVKWLGSLASGQEVPGSDPAVGVILWVSLFATPASPRQVLGVPWQIWHLCHSL